MWVGATRMQLLRMDRLGVIKEGRRGQYWNLGLPKHGGYLEELQKLESVSDFLHRIVCRIEQVVGSIR